MAEKHVAASEAHGIENDDEASVSRDRILAPFSVHYDLSNRISGRKRFDRAL